MPQYKLDISGHRKDNSIPTYNQSEFYIQLKLLYKTHQPHELCPMPPFEVRCSVSIPESGVHIMFYYRYYSHLNAGFPDQKGKRRPSKDANSARNIQLQIKFSQNGRTWKHTISTQKTELVNRSIICLVLMMFDVLRQLLFTWQIKLAKRLPNIMKGSQA